MAGELFNLFKKRKEEKIFNDKPKMVEYKHIVGICIPGAREFISTESAFSFMGLSCPNGVGRVMTSKDVQPINHCRNLMVQETLLANDKVTHILMLEPDVKLNPGTLWELFSFEGDIISVPVFDALAPHSPNIYKSETEKMIDFDKVEDKKIRYRDMYATDPGCVLIKKQLFEDLGVGYFKYDDDYKKSDMFSFCERARKRNYTLRTTTQLWCHRMAHTEISYRYFKEFREYEERKKSDNQTI